MLSTLSVKLNTRRAPATASFLWHSLLSITWLSGHSEFWFTCLKLTFLASNE
uniref:Uncharacterized protein n=1 Tax=Rhizophora mucronata TaxID=61149 RepID=A0A2P2NH09_RHIMU